jgi:hypothetical protein
MVPAILPRPAGSNVVPLAWPSRATLPDAREALAPLEPGFAAAAPARQLQLALAWSYPRLCYALWSGLMTLPSRHSDR